MVIVYVGAVSILFIFVIMMLNVRLLNLYYYILGYYIPFSFFLGSFIILLLFYYLFLDIPFINYYSNFDPSLKVSWVNIFDYKSNLNLIGEVFFNYYYYLLILAALILLLAMLGAIILTNDSQYNNKVFMLIYYIKRILDFLLHDYLKIVYHFENYNINYELYNVFILYY